MTSSPVSLPTRQRCFLFLHFVSFAFLYVPNGIGFYFGNLAVYLNSYWYAKLDTPNLYTPWIISIFIAACNVSIIVAGNVTKISDRRVLTFIGVLLFDTGIFTSHLSVQVSQTLFILTFGGMTGVGLGLIQSEALSRMPTLVERRTGLAYAVLYNFIDAGAIMVQWLITQYANPLNLKAGNHVLGYFDVFSQKGIIDRVPDIFIAVGILTCVCHCTGLILTVLLKDRGAIPKRENETLKHDVKHNKDPETNQVPEETQGHFSAVVEKQSKIYQTSHSSFTDTEPPTRVVSDSQKCLCATTKAQAVTEDVGDITEDLNHWQMLRTMTFYVMWFTIFAFSSTYVVSLNFYKIFGQLWIDDDHFLTRVGVAGLCVVVIMRILLGLVFDRCGVKTTLILLGSSMSLTFALYYFTPQLNRWLFALFTCIIMGLGSSVYVCMPIMTLGLFGRTGFASKYGIAATATVVLNLIAPPIFKSLLNHFGWPAVFLCTSAVNTLAFIFNVLGLPGGC